MKLIINFFRIVVGIAFILSGLIKLNDPLGFSYKLEEYFSAEVLNLPFLVPFALAIAFFVVVYEVVLGVFLLLGFKPKLTVWSLIAMIVFFTFLTFYSAYFDKVKDCGCFGDAIKLSPWGSFTKDLVFLAFLIPIYLGIKHVKPLFKPKVQWLLAAISVIFCTWLGYNALNHLPIIDFRPYSIGSNISEGMAIPEDAPKAIIDYHWTFKVNGEDQVMTTQGSYPDVEGEFVDVETEIIKEGYAPPIYDFSIESIHGDLTEIVLNKENVVMVVSYKLGDIKPKAAKAIKRITDKAIENGYTVLGLSASGDDTKAQLKEKYDFKFTFYLCDEKELKAVVRANPGVLVIDKGTVMQKVHWKDIDQLELPEVKQSTNLFEGGSRPYQDDMLVVLDGNIISQEILDMINPEMIENIEITKDSLQISEYTSEPYKGLVKIKLKKTKNKTSD